MSFYTFFNYKDNYADFIIMRSAFFIIKNSKKKEVFWKKTSGGMKLKLEVLISNI